MKKLALFTISIMMTSLLINCGGKINSSKKCAVYFDSDGGTSIDPIRDIEYDTVIGQDKMPTDPTKEDDIWKYRFDGWYNNEAPFDLLNSHVYGDTYLKAKWIQDEQKTYTLNVTKGDHLTFVKKDKGTEFTNLKITAGEPVEFCIKLIEETSNGVEYLLPSSLNIFVKGSTTPLMGGYTIDPIDAKKALVTINADKVVGDISITGDAIVEGGYQYSVMCHYGLSLDKEDFGIVTKDEVESFLFKFTPTGTYEPAKAENIYVQFDNVPEVGKKWVNAAESDLYCSFEDNTLSINPTYISTNINIVARSSSYPLLESLDWKEIEKVAFYEVAPYVFYLGEEKTLMLNNREHRVRIIGFNQDRNRAGIKLNITFEFVDAISGANGYSLATQWNDVNDSSIADDNYITSTINKALNNKNVDNIFWAEKGKTTWSKTYNHSVYDMLPDDLKHVIKSVEKKSSVFDQNAKDYFEQKFDAELFLLSPKEMGYRNKNQEPTTFVYHYYQNAPEAQDAKRIKKQCAKDAIYDKSVEISAGAGQECKKAIKNFAGFNPNGGGSKLFTRSPYTGGNETYNFTWALNEAGGFEFDHFANGYAFAIAPAFCI